jgi:hypothetical protein
MSSPGRFFDYSAPRGPFSDRSPPPQLTAGQTPFCVWTIYGHGELLWSPTPETRSTSANINAGWGHDMPELGPFSRINYTVSKVVGPESHAPGLATSSHDAPTTTNFALHIPKMTEVVTDNVKSGALNSTTLDILGDAVMKGIKQVDTAFGIIYANEKTSVPETTSDADFYQTFKIDKDNFWKADIRKIYMKPNFGEWLRASGRPTRAVIDGPHPFPIYGFFIIYAQGGSLPQSCTLYGAQDSLYKRRVEVNEIYFPTFDEEKVKKYNLISVENRVAVERKMGYILGFLDINGNPITGMDSAWNEYRHNTYGVIQLLRRVIKTEEITHVEAARIIQALGYNDMLGMDSACNCPGDRVVPQPPAAILDSQDKTVLLPIAQPILAMLTEDKLIELEQLRKTQEDVLKLVRTVLTAADEAAAEAARAAKAAEDNETKEVINAFLRAAEIKARDAGKGLTNAVNLIKGPAFIINDPLLVRTIGEAKEAAQKAKEARDKAKAKAKEAAQTATEASARSRSNSPPPPPPPPQPGGGSAKKYSRKRARSRTQKQKRYISRKNKQMKKYAKRHTMRNRRRNTSNKYSSL